MRNILLLILALLTCSITLPAAASAQSRIWYGPVFYGEGWYCPKARWDNDCYVRGHARQEVCDLATGYCRVNKWWL